MNFNLAAVSILLLSFSAGEASASKTKHANFIEENTVVLTSDGIPLSGVWTLPSGNLKGVILLIQGSGNVSSDGDVSGPLVGHGHKGAPAKLSDQLAQTLAQKGIASLRYSKRGVEDPAQLANQTLDYMIEDARTALNLSRVRFPVNKIGIVGFSEGALIATVLASTEKLDSLFLLSPITRAIDDALAYQFIEWPIDLIEKNLDLDRNGKLGGAEVQDNPMVPLMGPGFTPIELANFDVNKDREVSITDELIPAYRKLHLAILGMLQQPAFLGWYESYKRLAPFGTYASTIHAPVYMYQAMNDSQVKWSDSATDLRYFAGPTELRLFSSLGHCFSPMEGSYGEIKTSGPLSEDLLSTLAADVESSF